MSDPSTSSSVSKRKFLQSCLLCAGGMALGLPLQKRPGRNFKEALFYEKTPNGVQCHKCPHECLLEEGETGICRNRVNWNGILYSTAYGNPCAVHVDPIEKKPFYHFLPSTRAFSIAAAGCNFRCLNCQNWQISQASPDETINEDLMPEAVVAQCVKEQCESIAYTYSEPTTFYEYALDTATLARAKGIKSVLKSNGSINEMPLRRLCKVIDAANIDLKGFDEDLYRRLSSAKLNPVLQSLKVLKEEGVWLEITNLVIPGWTDDMHMIKRMCDWLAVNGFTDAPLHFSRFMPLHKLTQLPMTPVATLEQARGIARASGLRYVYIGNVPAHTSENTSCPACNKMIIERRGFRIVARRLRSGRCEFCNEPIAGVWSL